MTEQRISEIYQMLGEARVPLPPDQQGPQVLLEKLREVRRWQDAVISLTTEVMRASAGAKKAIRALQGLVSSGEANSIREYRRELTEAKDQLDDLRSLDQAIRVCRNNLKTTESDIRLCSHLLDLQIKLGEIQPKEAPTPAPPAPSPHAQHQPLTTIEGIFAPLPAAPGPANLRGPLHRSAPEVSGVAVAEALDIDSFFATTTRTP